MKIMLFHNKYVWPGGEDESFRAEAALLRSHGHDVLEYVTSNESVIRRGVLSATATLLRGAWSNSSYAKVHRAVRRFRPDIVHVHNFWFVLSPSILTAAHDAGVPVVMKLANFRTICPGTLLDNSGAPVPHASAALRLEVSGGVATETHSSHLPQSQE